MQPGIPRATAGAFLTFFFGAALVTLLRLIFGFEPLWNLGLASVGGVFSAAAGFIWGMGGFNPAMSEHPDDSKPEPTPEELAEKYGAASVVGSVSWTVAFVSLIIMVVVIGLSYVPGLGLTVTDVDNASVKSLGVVELSLFGDTIPVNQGVLLLAVIAFTVFSLAVAAGLIGAVVYALNREITTVKKMDVTGTGLPRGLERQLAKAAGQLADRIAPPEDKETTAVVVKKD